MVSIHVSEKGPVIRDCRHGIFAFYPNDVIGKMLNEYGEWAEDEVRLFKYMLRPGDYVLDIGAHIGTISIPLARHVGSEGLVLSFEAQAEVFRNLATNVFLNKISNIRPVHCLVGESDGSINLQNYPLEQATNSGGFNVPMGKSSPPSFLGTRILALDNLLHDLPRCRLIKMDIEGYEPAAIKGMLKLINKLRPAIYFEANSEKDFIGTQKILSDCGYHLHWHVESHWNEENFRSSKSRLYANLVDINVLALPSDWSEAVPPGLKPATQFGEVAHLAIGSKGKKH